MSTPADRKSALTAAREALGDISTEELIRAAVYIEQGVALIDGETEPESTSTAHGEPPKQHAWPQCGVGRDQNRAAPSYPCVLASTHRGMHCDRDGDTWPVEG